jgi:hypothetical protein
VKPFRWTVGVAAALVTGYAWVATALRPFTLPALAATLGGGLVAIAVGVRLPPGVASPGSERHGGGWVWAALAGAVTVWELQSFLQHPRSDHPTLSSLSNHLLQSHPSRTAAMLVWLAAGVWLARR